MWIYSGESVVLVIGAITGLLASCCFGMRLSRCRRISLCCGACLCERDVETAAEIEMELHNQNNRLPKAPAQQAEPPPSVEV